jgi:hypothetical protein
MFKGYEKGEVWEWGKGGLWFGESGAKDWENGRVRGGGKGEG